MSVVSPGAIARRAAASLCLLVFLAPAVAACSTRDPARPTAGGTLDVDRSKVSGPHVRSTVDDADDGGHAWPGRPRPAMEAAYGHGTTDVDATALMFELFSDHRWDP